MEVPDFGSSLNQADSHFKILSTLFQFFIFLVHRERHFIQKVDVTLSLYRKRPTDVERHKNKSFGTYFVTDSFAFS